MLLLAAAQLLQPEALPPAMEPALNRYGECVFAHIGTALETERKKDRERLIDAAFAQCREARASSIAKAETALSDDPRFRDPDYRKAYVENRFDELDAMARETARGDFDPGKWK